MNKRLFLTSEGKHLESLKKLKKFIGGSFKGKKLVYIPTAANGQHYGAWKASESVQIVSKLGAEFKIVELESCVYGNVYSQIKDADIMWVAGGQTGYFLYWFRRSKLDKKLNNLLENGMVYVGSSAGSMACSKTQYASEFYIGEPEPGVALLPGYGLIDFEIYPHYEEGLLPQLKKIWKPSYCELYLIKDGEAITVTDNKIEILGKKRLLKDGKLTEK
ncbi:Type 1 glutamine amidotransferase-like domain-containing protein [Patescibacteria group bacterium]|nr:Type 1 glutamine amidotransferase-like domain-containing protein [Patescibacteria group bacterium]